MLNNTMKYFILFVCCCMFASCYSLDKQMKRDYKVKTTKNTYWL